MGYLDEPYYIELRRLKEARFEGKVLTEQDFLEAAKRIMAVHKRFFVRPVTPKEEEEMIKADVNILKYSMRF